MPRKLLKRQETRTPRFLTFSCQKRLPLLNNAKIRDVFVEALVASHDRYNYKLIAWVVMPEHIHLVVTPTNEQVPILLRSIKQSVSQSVLYRWKELDAPILKKLAVGVGRYRFWQAGGGFDRNIRHADELAKTIDYIHKNPVIRSLVDSPTDWAWSSARAYANWPDQIPIDHITW